MELEAERLKILHCETTAVESQVRERRMGRNHAETLERARLWEVRTREAEDREEM